MALTKVGSLAGRHIVVTRPAGQATHLAEALVELGAHPGAVPRAGDRGCRRIRRPCWMRRFASSNTTGRCSSAPTPSTRRSQWYWRTGRGRRSVRVATVGQSSEAGAGASRHPQRGGAAGAFRLRGAAGTAPAPGYGRQARHHLSRRRRPRSCSATPCKARGAQVDYVTCYLRSKPALDPAPLLKLWGDGRLDALTITSSEGLRNLYEMVGKLGQSWLKKTPTFVPHARIAEQARALGLTQVILTGPADAGLLAGLIEHLSSP